jgi:hypothetical protein
MLRVIKKWDILVMETDLEIPNFKSTEVIDAKNFENLMNAMGKEETQKMIAVRVTVRIPCHLNCPLLRLDASLESIR